MATETLRPNAAGDSAQFDCHPNTGEANWQDVDEVVADDNTTYVDKSRQPSDIKDLYNVADPTFADGAKINSVTVYWRCRYFSSPTNISGYYGIKSGATESWSAKTSFGAWANYNTVYNTDPNTGVAWTKAAITALQVGVKVATADYDGGMACTQVYVEVDYTPAKPRSYGYIIG